MLVALPLFRAPCVLFCGAELLGVPVAPLVFRAPEGPAVRAGLLGVPVGGGPPASRPRREPLARRAGSLSGKVPPPPTGAAARPARGYRVWVLQVRRPGGLKPPSPLLACVGVGLKPPSPLQVRNGCIWCSFRTQR